MIEDKNKNIRKISKLINSYLQKKESSALSDIKTYLKAYFDVNQIEFYIYDKHHGIHDISDSDSMNFIELSSSISKRVIDTKIPLLSNRLVSDRNYTPEVDNSQGYKIKDLFTFPLLKEREVVGIVKLCRGLQHRRVFTKKDQKSVEEISLLLLRLLQSQKITDEEMIEIIGKTAQVSPTQTKKEIKVKEKSVSQSSMKNQDSIENLQKQLAITRKQLEEFQLHEVAYQTKIQAYESEIKNHAIEYEALEKSSLELYDQLEEQTERIKEIAQLKERLQDRIDENQSLREEIKESKHSVQSIQEIKAQQHMKSEKRNNEIDDNIEFILAKVSHIFGEHEYAYMLFEILVYSLHSKKGIADLNEIIQKSKLVPKIIDEFYFKGDTKLYNEKFKVEHFVDYIKRVEEMIFSENVKFNIFLDKNVPFSLIFDAPKVESIILHLLFDLYELIDPQRDIMVKYRYEDKMFMIELGGFVPQNNSLFQSMFKQTKLSGNEKDRVGLLLSKKLIERLKGSINIDFKEEYYNFIITLPAQLVKM